MKKYVLIGGSIACHGAIEGIRSVDNEGEITVLCGEKTPLYSRPLISYRLEGKTTEQNLFFRGKDYYEKKGVKAVASYGTADKNVFFHIISPRKRWRRWDNG